MAFGAWARAMRLTFRRLREVYICAGLDTFDAPDFCAESLSSSLCRISLSSDSWGGLDAYVGIRHQLPQAPLNGSGSDAFVQAQQEFAKNPLCKI